MGSGTRGVRFISSSAGECTCERLDFDYNLRRLPQSRLRRFPRLRARRRTAAQSQATPTSSFTGWTGLGRARATSAPAACLLYTSDAADDLLCVDLGGRRII